MAGRRNLEQESAELYSYLNALVDAFNTGVHKDFNPIIKMGSNNWPAISLGGCISTNMHIELKRLDRILATYFHGNGYTRKAELGYGENRINRNYINYEIISQAGFDLLLEKMRALNNRLNLINNSEFTNDQIKNAVVEFLKIPSQDVTNEAGDKFQIASLDSSIKGSLKRQLKDTTSRDQPDHCSGQPYFRVNISNLKSHEGIKSVATKQRKEATKQRILEAFFPIKEESKDEKRTVPIENRAQPNLFRPPNAAGYDEKKGAGAGAAAADAPPAYDEPDSGPPPGYVESGKDRDIPVNDSADSAASNAGKKNQGQPAGR